MPIKFRDPPEITPAMRAQTRVFARSRVTLRRAWRYPFTTFVDVASVLGLPLEAVRWINLNSHKPGRWLKGITQHRLWPENLLRLAYLKLHRPPKKTFEIATEDELYEFLARFSKKDRRYTYGKWFYLEPGDHIFNREIVPPKTHPYWPNGATAVRFDDDFWVCAVLPYRFREISLETLVDALYPDIPKDQIQYRPDSGSAEQKAFYEEEQKNHDAWKIAIQRYGKDEWEHLDVVRSGENFVAKFLGADDTLVHSETVTPADFEQYYKDIHERYGA